MRTKKIQYVGLIPAAGCATRLQNLPFSKEIYPMHVRGEGGQIYEFPVCEGLIRSYSKADINNVYMIIREGKDDICQKLGNGGQYGLDIVYLYTKKTFGPPYTLDQAYSLIHDNYVALGFPDILFKPRHAFKQLIEKQQETNADVVLGLFHAPNPKKMDMVAFDQTGKIYSIDIKPQNTALIWTWILAVWNPDFSEFMHRSLKHLLSEFESGQRAEIHVGTVFQSALKIGMTFDFVFFDKGELIDIGTPEDLDRTSQVFVKDEWTD